MQPASTWEAEALEARLPDSLLQYPTFPSCQGNAFFQRMWAQCVETSLSDTFSEEVNDTMDDMWVKHCIIDLFRKGEEVNDTMDDMWVKLGCRILSFHTDQYNCVPRAADSANLK